MPTKRKKFCKQLKYNSLNSINFFFFNVRHFIINLVLKIPEEIALGLSAKKHRTRSTTAREGNKGL